MRNLICVFLVASSLGGETRPDSGGAYEAMRWRCIGPYRGGRTVAATGIPERANEFLVGVCNGGVWKTTDYGQTWKPIFDDQPTGSIGAIAVAPSDPNTIYVGSGEGLQRPDLSTGDGIYKSKDGGISWTHLGLRDGQQIGSIVVDPQNPNRLFVAVLGHPYGPNAERGVFRSLDGGLTFQKVLYKDENTGAIALAFAPGDPKTIYADLWAARQGPWENGQWQGPGSGLYKSTDGGDHWLPLTKGLPGVEQHVGRIGFAIAPSNPRKMYATVQAETNPGIYRSDDAGASWVRVCDDGRVYGRGDDFAEVRVDPKNENVVYAANTSTYRSDDAGANFTAIKGAPGGDDYHTVWIDPENPNVILLASDQGATISVNHGQTWSSWYNQPTAQFYHVMTDNHFPYWVYGGQQESGSAMVASRGNDGQITFREWHPVAADEYAYVAPDPLNPNLVYSSHVTRYHKDTGESEDVGPSPRRRGRGPASGPDRYLRTAPLVFSTVDPHALYLGSNFVYVTKDGAKTWTAISPDLSRETTTVPAAIGVYRTPALEKMARRGVVYTLAPGYVNANTVWAGTDDGLIHVTKDGGKTWKNVTPPGVDAWSKVSIVDAGRFDDETAYAAVNRIRLDDQRPHIYRTHDGGQSWTEIVAGLPLGPVNSVREDPVRKGLLFAGTETAVFFSLDDGDNWQPLRLNMPATSIRDLVVHGVDLVVGTHGRGFWILDDISPLRQASPAVETTDAVLFEPAPAYHVAWNNNSDTPLPPEFPAGQNPPDGAILYFRINKQPKSVVALEILDASGKLVRRYASDDKLYVADPHSLGIPTYWIRPPRPLVASPGTYRWVWDEHGTPPGGGGFTMAAIAGDTQMQGPGPWAPPGIYRVRLTVDGKKYEQKLTLLPDPRSRG